MKLTISRKTIKYVIILVLIASLGTGGYIYFSGLSRAANAANAAIEMMALVARGDIDVTISGTGTVEPYSRYDIIPLVRGGILSAPFEEGMQVKKGDLLYKIDDSELSYSIQRAKNNIEKMKMSNQETIDSKNNLTVYAPCDGRITNFTAKTGEQVGNNAKIADVIDDRYISAVIPFHNPYMGKIKEGQQAQLSIPDNLWYIDGKVKYVNNATIPVAEGGSVFNVEIEIKNPGAFAEGMQVEGVVKGPDGNMYGASKGTTKYSVNEAVIARTSGKVKEVYVKNNDWVTKGQKILVLENESLDNTIYRNSLDLKDAQIQLDSQIKQLDDYNILSPIDGVVVKKNYKEGDTINNASSNTILMTVADMTKMVFTMNVDELDIAKVEPGQKVSVTADALPGVTLAGEVTGISVEGNSQNGVTTYPVQITIPEPGKLKPGMNVNAKILVESRKGILYVPIAAVTKVGDKAFVFVKNDGTPAGVIQRAEGSSGQESEDGSARRPAGRMQRTAGAGGAAEGRQRREVVLGINNEDYIEIISGLQEGETVYVPSVSANNNTTGNMVFPNPMGGGGAMRIPAGGAGGARFGR